MILSAVLVMNFSWAHHYDSDSRAIRGWRAKKWDTELVCVVVVNSYIWITEESKHLVRKEEISSFDWLILALINDSRWAWLTFIFSLFFLNLKLHLPSVWIPDTAWNSEFLCKWTTNYSFFFPQIYLGNILCEYIIKIYFKIFGSYW